MHILIKIQGAYIMKRALILIALAAFATLTMAATPVFAEPGNTNDEIIVDTVDPIGNPSETEPVTPTPTQPTLNQPGEVATFSDLVNRIILKLNEVLDGVKAIANPLIMILFVSAALTALFGAMSKKGTV